MVSAAPLESVNEPSWRDHILPLPDHNLAWYELGSGPVVIGLSGGPGDDHTYLRPVVEPLAAQLRWILYDQRGTGSSVLDRQDNVTLQAERLVADLDALRRHLGQERVTLFGHSWGANLALLYAATHPTRVDRVVLVGLGPIDDELGAVAAANFMKGLSLAERRDHADLTQQFEQAIAVHDPERMADLHARRIVYFAHRAFHSREKAETFVEAYLAAGTHRKVNHRVNRLVSASYRAMPILQTLDRVTASLLVVYGYQDFEPITQAYLLRDRIPQTRISFLNRCGHVPWLEQPEAFYRELEAFFSGD